GCNRRGNFQGPVVHGPRELSTVVRTVWSIMVDRQATPHGFRQSYPVCPMASDQIQIAAAIGAMIGIQRCCSQPAVPIADTFFLQYPDGCKIATKDAQTPFADLELLGKIRNRP